ncbi:small glutamine-rich tetratricopeptide repeat-containing protein beta-like isoform X2 [Myxocyprinus asiaticus]|uniref:small glutamine-rich tetratricopeptide repeat-containing protein beta-like isoform X2 n=1 Tax=Myxocyprinus asiaticus TaxID=70543 RepID=UPI002222996B|nr:small glutamine-rich tetratricopeptide repeat-containing protein beta-like isoform X2 [Myxocyprinus asiaticus]
MKLWLLLGTFFRFLPDKMAVEKRLAYSIVQFLRDQTNCGSLNSGEQESLEVAIQCLETTFKIRSSDFHLAGPQPLREIFLNSLLKNDVIPLSELSPSPEDIERAEQLKNEGNNHMKEENYSSAVDCYTKAIELDQRNAVYYCNRAAAHSKLGNYTKATVDCERAIAIDTSYSKAYGRMGLALTSMSKYPEAISYFKKALVLDPENDTYKSNLKIAEQKQKEASNPTAAGLGFDMASLINNPAFISMAASVMQNQQVQQLGQQFAQQIQQQNPELIEQLRNHIRSRSFSGSAEEHS